MIFSCILYEDTSTYFIAWFLIKNNQKIKKVVLDGNFQRGHDGTAAMVSGKRIPTEIAKENEAASLPFSSRAKYLECKAKKTLEEATTILSVRQHPAIRSSDLHLAMKDSDLPFRHMVVRRKSSTIGSLVVREDTCKTSIHPIKLSFKPR